MKFILLFLLLSINTFAATVGSINLGEGDPGVAPYTDFASFPSLAPDGSIAVDLSTHDLYIYNLGTLTWDLFSGGGGGGGVTSVGATAPIASSGGATPVISMAAATALVNGYLTSANFVTFNSKEPAITATSAADYYRGDKTFATLDKTAVGLANVDNTSDANKPVSTAQDTAINAKVADAINNGTTTIAPSQNAVYDALSLKQDAIGFTPEDVANKSTDGAFTANSDTLYPSQKAAKTYADTKEPAITATTAADYYRGDKVFATLDKAAVGLGNVDNTSDANKPVSTAQDTAINAKVADAINDGTTTIAPSQNAVFDALALKEDLSNKDTDGTLASNSDTKYPSQKAVKTYVDTSAGTKWSLSGNTGTGGTANLGTTDAQNWDLIAGNATVATVIESYKGISAAPTVVPADATGVNQFDWRTYVSPSVSTDGASHTNHYSALIWDNGNAGFNNINGNLIASNSSFSHNGSGSINYASTNSNSAGFNNGTTAQFKGVTSENSVASGATVSDYYGTVSGLTTVGGTITASKGFSQYANYNNATVGNISGYDSNMVMDGTTANSQGITSYNGFINFSNSTTAVNPAYGVSIGIDANNTAAPSDFYGFNSYFNVRDTSTVGFLYGLNIGVNQEDGSVSDGANFININSQYSGTSTGNSVNMMNAYVRTTDTADLSSLTGLNMNPELEGTSTLGSYTGLNIGGQIRGSAAIPNVTGGIINPQMSGSAAVDNFQGLYVNPQINGTSTLTNGITGATVKPEGSVLVSGATGLSVDMSQISLTSGALAAGSQKAGLNISDGALSSNYNYTVPGASGFFQINYLGGGPTVASGDPVSAFGFGNNLAHTVTLHDDWTIDGSGLGFVDVGFVGALAFDTGTTMAQWTGALGGAGNPSGAGTLTTAKMFSAAGILPQGGSLSVTNMYGFEVNPNLFCIIGTNCWGFFENTPAAENHLSKLAIGTSNQKVESGVLLDVAGPIQTNDELRLQDPGAGTDKIVIQAPTLTGDYTLTLPPDDGAAGECFKTDGSGVTSWGACTAGGGDVVGPASATDEALARFDTTTGKLIQNSTATLTDAGTLTATAFSGPLTGNVTGNADTATALAANPTDCAAGTKATAIAANGDLTCSAVADGDISSGVDAAKIADGSVSNTEFQYINSLTSNVQTQLGGKQNAFTEIQESVSGTINNSNDTFTITQTPVSNASVKLYLSGLMLVQGVDYTISGSTITMDVASIPNFGQTLYANYRY